jgi:hypothetical protein
LKNWKTNPMCRRRRCVSSSRSSRQATPGENDLAVTQRLEAGDKVQQRRLAAPGRAGDGDDLALSDNQVDSAQRPHGDSLGLEGLAEADGHQDFRRCRHTTTVNRACADRNQATWMTNTPAAC